MVGLREYFETKLSLITRHLTSIKAQDLVDIAAKGLAGPMRIYSFDTTYGPTTARFCSPLYGNDLFP
jgi:hypothetical protein